MIRFDVKDYQLVIHEQTLMVHEFDCIVQHDKSKDKKQARQDLLYVYLMYDEDSAYGDFPAEAKERAIKQNVYRDGDYAMPPERQVLIDAAIEEYARLNDSSEKRLYWVMRRKVDAITTFLDKLDIVNEETFKLAVSTLGSVEKMLVSKRNTEDIIEKGLTKSKSKTRGNMGRSPMETGALQYQPTRKK